MSSGELSDHEFLDYCLAHSTTPRAGFIGAHVKRVYKLAGIAIDESALADGMIYSVHYEDMKPLVDKARHRLASGEVKQG